MLCQACGQRLEVDRRCRRVRLRCTGCKKEYKIHEVASQLDAETEEQLGQYTSIIYD